VPSYFEPNSASASDPGALAIGCIEAGCRAMLLDEGVAPPEFFDLSTRFAGELLHRMGLYELRLAVVAPDLSLHSHPFQAFVREANRGGRYRFFATREAAVAWLEGA